MSLFSKWKLFWTAIIALVFYAFGFSTPGSDLQQQSAIIFLAFVIGHFTMPWFKKYAFKKTIAFDMGGVVVKGDFFTEEQTPIAGTRELIEGLKDNYKVALATNNNALAFVPFKEKFGFASLFDYIIVSGEIGVKKPDLKYFEKLVEATGSKPSDIIFFDDTLENVEAAKKLGIKGVVFKDPGQAKEALKAMGLRV